MKTTRLITLLLATALLARADVLPPAQDSSSLKGKLTPVTGKATTLAVSATRKGYVLFNLASLPQDLVAADIVNARLRVYFPAAKKPGDIAIHTVTAGWVETTTALEPGISVPPVAMFPAATVVGKKFVEVDVTSAVQAWRTTPATNFGFAFVASGLTNVLIGSKEGSGSGYPCELDIEIQRDFALADGSITTAQLADATITNAKLASAAISITAGSGLSGGGTISLGGTTTISLGTNLTLGGTTSGTFSGSLSGNATTATTAGNVTGIVALANGGTGSATQNFVDLSTNQSAIAGNKTFIGDHQVSTAFVVEARPNNTGTANLFIGSHAGVSNTGGDLNTAIGPGALVGNTMGAQNTAIGHGALSQNVTGNSNTASGANALALNRGDLNTAFGQNALLFNKTGSNNTALGYQAGLNLTTGDNNIDIGHEGVAGESNIIRIGTPGTQTDTYLTGIIHGDGSGLTGIPATSLASGLTLGGTTSGNFSGDGSGLTGVVATSATVATTVSRSPQQIALLKWGVSSVNNTFPVGTSPVGICFDGASIWVANFNSANVTKLNASTGAVQGTFAVGSGPNGICFDGASIWVANFNSNNVTKL